MPTVQLVEDPSVKASCTALTALQQEVSKAYFAERTEEAQYETEVVDHKTTKGQSLPVIAKQHGVKESALKRTGKAKILQVDEIVKVTKKKKTGAKVTFKEINSASIGSEVYIIVETKHLREEKALINILQGQEDVLVKKDEIVSVQQDGKSVDEITAIVGDYCDDEEITNKDDFADWAIVKVKLLPEGDKKQKEWTDGLSCVSTNKAALYLMVDLHTENSIPEFESVFMWYRGFTSSSDDSTTQKYFLNQEGEWFEVEKVEWHEPIKDPTCTLYMQSGGAGEFGKHWGLFGKTRDGKKHTGLDLFATTGTDIFACVDGTVYNRRWHGGYGNTITIKVTDTEAFKSLKNDYSLQFSSAGEIKEGTSWSDAGDIYLFYGHLDSVNEYDFGDEVKCGDVLGTTGRSGVTAGTKAPHLHFEIFCDYKFGVGTNYRINPAFFVDYKGFDDQSDTEKASQKTEMEKGKTKEVNGVEKLVYANMTGFVE